MQKEPLLIHSTITKRFHEANGEGWEFSCYQCKYCVRYLFHSNNQEYQLEILDFGDSRARHTSNTGNENPDPDFRQDGKLIPDEEAWLTPELRQKIDEIIKRFD